jgi:hypothetical protein
MLRQGGGTTTPHDVTSCDFLKVRDITVAITAYIEHVVSCPQLRGISEKLYSSETEFLNY